MDPGTCRRIARRLPEYVDGASDPAGRERVEAHLAACPECAQKLRALRRTVALLGELPPERLSADRRDALLKKLAQPQQQLSTPPRAGAPSRPPAETDPIDRDEPSQD